MKKTSARIFGICYILSFLSYGIGIGLMEPPQDIQSAPGVIIAGKSIMVTGGIMVVLLHTLLNLIAVTTMLHVLKPFNRVVASLYFSSAMLGTLLLAIGAVFLLLPLGIGERFLSAGKDSTLLFQTIVHYSGAGNFYCYQMGMALWGSGGLALCYLLRRSGLAPGFLPLFGLVGYSVFIAGTLLELFGYPLGILCAIPGGLFEIGLSIWLLFRGFKQDKMMPS